MNIKTYTKEETKELLKKYLEQGKFSYVQYSKGVQCTIYLTCSNCPFLKKKDQLFTCALTETRQADPESLAIVEEVLIEMYPEDFI